MRPDRKLTPAQLKGFFTPWHYAGVRMAWENRWVSIQPVAVRTSVPARVHAKTPAPIARPTAAPARAPTASAVPAVRSSQGSPAAEPSPGVVTGLVGSGSPGPGASPSTDSAPAPASAPIDLSAGLAVIVVALAVVGGLTLGARRRS
jgi:hypothetical protein